MEQLEHSFDQSNMEQKILGTGIKSKTSTYSLSLLFPNGNKPGSSEKVKE